MADECAQAQLSDEALLDLSIWLAIQEGRQAQISDKPVLTQLHKLISLECWQAAHSDNTMVTTETYSKSFVDPRFWASKHRRKRTRVYRTSSKKPGVKETVY
jgi:hypothetical protein